jgi:hypothetical protein
MHDLALHLGGTVKSLSQIMTEGEFHDWQRYAGKRMLPWRRMELYMAQLALLIATALGGAQGKSLSDFLFDLDDVSDAAEPTAEDEAAFFDFKPRNRKED